MHSSSILNQTAEPVLSNKQLRQNGPVRPKLCQLEVQPYNPSIKKAALLCLDSEPWNIQELDKKGGTHIW